jgi:hypothetical protein
MFKAMLIAVHFEIEKNHKIPYNYESKIIIRT